jgi:hypothetical protein
MTSGAVTHIQERGAENREMADSEYEAGVVTHEQI